MVELVLKFNDSLKKKKKLLKIKKTIKNLSMVNVLYNYGYLNGYEIVNNDIYIYLKNYNKKFLLTKIKLISTATRRIFLDVAELELYLKRWPNCVLSTSSGILMGKDALQQNVGGLVLFIII